LADVVAFGIAPVVFAYAYATQEGWLTLALVLFVLCGILRLACFNVVNLQGEYIGMPITMNGLMVPLIYWVGLPPWYYALVFVLSAGLMISPLRVKKVS
jgi:CDP-diacylglycerol--serine O-phosphatidyltransferase